MGKGRTYVTKVLSSGRIWWIAAICVGVWTSATAHAADIVAEKPAEALYLQLGRVELDPARVYQVRGASFNRSSIQISLDDGTIGFTQDVMGHITGAFFEGDGEILLTPPTAVERRSMSLFTGMAILEERFATAYFRFNDDVYDELRPDLRSTEDKQQFIDRWNTTAKNLAGADAMRLLLTFSRLLPVKGKASTEGNLETAKQNADRFMHMRLQGTKLGVFDVFYDSTAGEQIQAGQAKNAPDGDTYYDVWTSFSPLQAGTERRETSATVQGPAEGARINRVALSRFTITAEVVPPKLLHARAVVEGDVREGQVRTLLFELSRFLQIQRVSLDGEKVEYIQNPALEGTQLARRGNDVVAVVLPEPMRAGQKFALEFVYGGEVLAEAGSGLLYVGARGTWYPNRGMEMADFNLEFTYPQGWTLLATGKRAQVSAETAAKANGGQTSHWVSDRPIPLAGFNLGKYREATTRAGNVVVETYATVGVERGFPSAPVEVVRGNPGDPVSRPPEIVVPSRPSPAQTEVAVGESAARAIQYFADRFGPFPYSQLALTQMPGPESQGWPGLVFLSSFAFLDEQQRQEMHFEPYRTMLQQSIPAHEAAHQWWGDLITWKSYRDQWFSEGLANYCALMMLQEKDPAGFRQVMEKYRSDLLVKNKDGMTPMDAGPVTLGTRLLSSRFPEGYEAISYGRGTWLFHMLRSMMKDGEEKKGKGSGGTSTEEPFVRALRKVRQKYEGKSISTRELLDVLAEELPPSLRYEGKSSLDWFLDGWINGTSMPKFELKSVKFTPKGTGITVSGTILQKEAPEDLVTSVPVYAVSPGRQPLLLGRVFADGEETTFRLTAPAGVHKIALDSYQTVLTSPK
jgi:Peptidase family M1 domain